MSRAPQNRGAERAAPDRLMALVEQIIGTANVPRPVPRNVRLSEIGMTSIKMINLMLAIEGEFDISIPQAEITPDNFRSIASIEALVVRLIGP
jgi:acyl carrier protein